MFMLNYLENLKSELLNIVPSQLPEWLGDVKLPSQKVLDELLDVTFRASLQTEEQHGLSFRIMCCEGKMSKKRLRQDLHSRSELVSFNRPRKFSVNEIRKLALSTDINRTHIVVSFSPLNDDLSLEIIGLIHSGSTFEKSVVSVHHFGTRIQSYWLLILLPLAISLCQ